MKIKVKITRQENADYFNVSIDDIVEVEFEEYVTAVVASEVGNQNLEVCKAQAIASRTYAAQRGVLNGKVISDSSATAQAYRASRHNYAMPAQAAKETAGEALYYNGKLISAVYSACNGGHTTSAKERWGTDYPYLPAKDDPWDAASGKKRNGHGVGMSQNGIIQMAKQGLSCSDMLSFYYPGAIVKNLYKKEEDGMAKTVKASQLMEIANQIIAEITLWKYVANMAQKYKADCSGMLTWMYKSLGSDSYHGSNTLWRKWTVKKGRVGEIEMKRGMFVYKRREWTASQSGNPYYNDSIGDFYHVGIYIGNNEVLEAKSSAKNIVVSKLSDWGYAAEQKNTTYDTADVMPTPVDVEPIEAIGTVITKSTPLRIRELPSETATQIGKIPKGATVLITGRTDGWYKVEYQGISGYSSSQYISVVANYTPPQIDSEVDTVPIENKTAKFTVYINDPNKRELFEELMDQYEFEFTCETVED